MRRYDGHQTKALFRTLNTEPSLYVGGVELPPNEHWKVGHVCDLHLADVNLNGLKMAARFGSRGRFEGCQFVRVAMDGVAAKRIDFVRCKFQGVTFERFLTVFTGCRFEACEFYDCQIGGAHFEQTEFINCNLDSVRANSATCWEGCRFERTRLSGTLHHASFLGSAYRDSDFSRALLLNASFVDSKSGGVALPDTRRLFPVTPETFFLAMDRLRHRLDGDALRKYEQIAHTLADSSAVELVHHELFSGEMGLDGGGVVMDTLYEMSH